MSTRRRDGGQAAVEFALVLPLAFALLLGVVQVAVLVRHELAVQVAARAAARAAAVAADAAAAARDGALGAVRLRPLDIEVTLGPLRPRAADASDSLRRGPGTPDTLGTPGTADGATGIARTTAGDITVVTATVRYLDPTDVPVIGALIPSIELRAEVTMAVEPP